MHQHAATAYHVVVEESDATTDVSESIGTSHSPAGSRHRVLWCESMPCPVFASLEIAKHLD